MTVRKEEFIACLKLSYISAQKVNLPIYGIKAKELSKFTTSEKDAEKGISRIPSLAFLLEGENVTFNKESTVTKHSVTKPIPIEEEKVLDQGKDELAIQTEDYRSSRASLFSELTNEHFDLDDEELEFRNSIRSSTIFSKDGLVEANLEDFTIVRVLGIGAFGKVFLVENQGTGDVFAMKSIRKDKIVEYD